MFERFTRSRRSEPEGGVATAPREPARADGEPSRSQPAAEQADRERGDAEAPATRPRAGEAAATVRDPRGDGLSADEVRARQHDQFGGINWGSAFFGWLVAVGLSALLVGLLSAAGAAIGLNSRPPDGETAGTVSIVGGALLVIALVIAYYGGGYVAGRMSRFDGGRQGVAVWLLGLAMTIIAAVAGAALGSQYNLLGQLNLPSVPVDEATLATGGLITLAAIVVGTLLAAAAGGKAGHRYHRRVDRVGLS
jgi:hypothetical protein